MNSVPTMVTGFRYKSSVSCKTHNIKTYPLVLRDNLSIITKARTIVGTLFIRVLLAYAPTCQHFPTFEQPRLLDTWLVHRYIVEQRVGWITSIVVIVAGQGQRVGITRLHVGRHLYPRCIVVADIGQNR